jgi:hypothetical protein
MLWSSIFQENWICNIVITALANSWNGISFHLTLLDLVYARRAYLSIGQIMTEAFLSLQCYLSIYLLVFQPGSFHTLGLQTTYLLKELNYAALFNFVYTHLQIVSWSYLVNDRPKIINPFQLMRLRGRGIVVTKMYSVGHCSFDGLWHRFLQIFINFRWLKYLV